MLVLLFTDKCDAELFFEEVVKLLFTSSILIVGAFARAIGSRVSIVMAGFFVGLTVFASFDLLVADF